MTASTPKVECRTTHVPARAESRGNGLKPGSRLARGERSAVLAALVSILLASCSSTSEPSLELTNPAITDAGSPNVMVTDAAGQAITGEGDAALPEEVAATPAAKPGEKNTAAAEAQKTEEQPAAVAEAVAATEAKPDTSAAKASVTPPTDGPVLENGGPILTAGVMPQTIEPKKKSFLSSFFGSTPASAAPSPERQTKAKPIITLASAKTEEPAEKPTRLASLDDDDGGEFTLPGVRKTSLFEIKRKSGLDDDSDIDVHEDEDGAPVLMASAAGLARLAPNGLLKQRENVDVACLKPSLVRVLKTVERHFGKKMVVTSGYRSPTYNRKVNGARKSQHMYCAAADVQVPGVSKWELAKFVRTMPGRGGVGTYCHTESVHIDVGPERDWNWKCRARRT